MLDPELHSNAGYNVSLPVSERFSAQDILHYAALLCCQLLQTVFILLVCPENTMKIN